MSFFEELKRRNVFRAGAAYLVITWLLAQVAQLLSDTFAAPPFVMQLVVIAMAIGFPIALVLSWVYELTSKGIERTDELPAEVDPSGINGRQFDFVIIGVLLVAVALFALDRFVWRSIDLMPATDIKSIAVLPFANRSANTDDEYFVDGIHDDLLSQLTRIGDLKVISRTSVMQYRDTNKSLPVIAEELGVGVILEGGVQRAGEQIRINMQLIDAVTDEHLWANTYDRALSANNVFSIQTEITESIVTALQATLTEGEQRQIQLRQTDNLEAFNAYSLGNQRQRQRTLPAFDQAESYFLRAIELDANYAKAWAGLGYSLTLMRNFGSERQNLLTDARTAFDRALQIDQNDGEIWARLGVLESALDDREAAKDAYETAIRLSPNLAIGYRSYAGMIFDDNPDAAFELYKKAVELDPLNAITYLDMGYSARLLKKFREAKGYIHRSIELQPDYSDARRVMSGIHFEQGDLADAMTWSEEQLLLDPQERFVRSSLAVIASEMGDFNLRDSWRRDQHSLGVNNSRIAVWETRFLLQDGDLNAARMIAEKQYNAGATHIVFLDVLNEADIRNGTPESAVARYRECCPQYFDNEFSQLKNNRTSIDFRPVHLAHLLLLVGQTDGATRLLEDALHLESIVDQRLPASGSRLLQRALILALLQRTDEAYEILDSIPEAGWPGRWQASVVTHPYAVLRDTPQFQAMIARLEDHGAIELVRYQELKSESE